MNKRQDSWQNRSRLHSYNICLVEAATDWRSGIRLSHLTLDICSLNYSCTHLEVPVASSSRRGVPPACHRPCCALSCLLQAPQGCPEGLAQLNRQGLSRGAASRLRQDGCLRSLCEEAFFSLSIPVSNLVQLCQEHYGVALSTLGRERFLPSVAHLWSPGEDTEPFDLQSCLRADCLPTNTWDSLHV